MACRVVYVDRRCPVAPAARRLRRRPAVGGAVVRNRVRRRLLPLIAVARASRWRRAPTWSAPGRCAAPRSPSWAPTDRRRPAATPVAMAGAWRDADLADTARRRCRLAHRAPAPARRARPSLLARPLLAVVRGYQVVRAGRPSPCRFDPSCSTYALEALEVHGAVRGSCLALRRLAAATPGAATASTPCPEKKASDCVRPDRHRPGVVLRPVPQLRRSPSPC